MSDHTDHADQAASDWAGPSPEAWRRFGEIAFISLTRLAERDADEADRLGRTPTR